jgi:bifunctional non-homologous end joining protein LigD
VPSSRRIRDRRVHAARRLARGFGALLLGYYDQDGKLIYAGRVGTGFNQRTLAELRARLEPLRQAESPSWPSSS